MNIIEQLQSAFDSFLKKTFSLNDTQLASCVFLINADPDKQQFGDINTNAAMVLAKELGRNPREVAQEIVNGFTHDAVERIEIAGPGFLNLFLTLATFQELAVQLNTQKQNFFKLGKSAKRQKFNIEFVSANPTGPLHIGHGRGGIIGDVLANILNFIGHEATREFYINDAGAQIQKLGRSFKARLLQATGQDVSMPEDGYQGEYLADLAKAYVEKEGTQVAQKSEEELAEYAKTHLLGAIKKTLHTYGIDFDVWFSEKSLHTSNAIDSALGQLEKNNNLYEKDSALWFKSTNFGDDKDRVIRKSDGELTYIAADVAYLKNKIDRGFDRIIYVLGHDHHSYEVRLHAVHQAFGYAQQLDVIFYQLVKMKASGQMVRMSKRAGNIVSLEDVIETVGTDVARFFYLHRKADAQLEFDVDLALKRTEENPVYYVQYAYVRTNSILRKAQEEAELCDVTKEDAEHLSDAERLLLKKICSLKALLQTISGNYQTHQLTYYVLELAHLFHSYYGKNKVIDPTNVPQSRARLLLITLLRETFATALTLLGISRPDKM